MINLIDIKKKSPNTETVGVRVDPETKAWLDEFCKMHSITVTSLVLSLIKQFRKDQNGP